MVARVFNGVAPWLKSKGSVSKNPTPKNNQFLIKKPTNLLQYFLF